MNKIEMTSWKLKKGIREYKKIRLFENPMYASKFWSVVSQPGTAANMNERKNRQGRRV